MNVLVYIVQYQFMIIFFLHTKKKSIINHVLLRLENVMHKKIILLARK